MAGHGVGDQTAEEERGLQVGVDLRIPIGLGHLIEAGAADQQRRGVSEGVERAVQTRGGLDESFARRLIDQIEG